MSLYRRGGVWWYKFRFCGHLVRESSKSASKTVAGAAERRRRRDLEESFNRLSRKTLPPPFSVAARTWLASKTNIAPHTETSYRACIAELEKFFGRTLLSEVSADDIAHYQTRRKRQGLGGRSINLEIRILRCVLRKYRLWEEIRPDVGFLKENPTPGRALSEQEEKRLLSAASQSRCRGLYPVLTLALNTGLRVSELRTLQWQQVDFLGEALTVGRSKTAAGTGRVVPLNQRALAALRYWRSQFSNSAAEHYVFPHEKYGLAGNDRRPLAYQVDPGRPMKSWQTAWRNALQASGVRCRFHDLRHTFISRLAESQASDSTIMALAGHVSRSMLERYSHIRMEAKRKAVQGLSGVEFDGEGAQKRARFSVSQKA